MTGKTLINPICIAPMMKYSTPQMRYLWRQLYKECLLYTEMQTALALLGAKGKQKIGFLSCENPLAIQLAGDSPQALADCSAMAEEEGYVEINLNLGCPSSKASQGAFGACLMKNPDVCALCVESMANASTLPVSVKLRTGVDDLDSFAYLKDFTQRLVDAGAQKIIIHARKAWLKGLNPRQNRTVPQLNYERVYSLKQAFPDIAIVLNGGIYDIQTIKTALLHTDGVMLGRVAYEDPMFLSIVAKHFHPKIQTITRQELLEKLLNYALARWEEREPFRCTGRHLLNLYKGFNGARAYRRHLTHIMSSAGQPPSLDRLLSIVPEQTAG